MLTALVSASARSACTAPFASSRRNVGVPDASSRCRINAAADAAVKDSGDASRRRRGSRGSKRSLRRLVGVVCTRRDCLVRIRFARFSVPTLLFAWNSHTRRESTHVGYHERLREPAKDSWCIAEHSSLSRDHIRLTKVKSTKSLVTLVTIALDISCAPQGCRRSREGLQLHGVVDAELAALEGEET